MDSGTATNDLLHLFLTDDVLAPATAPHDSANDDEHARELSRFTERLHGLLTRQLAQITAFAEKEDRPEHEIRRWIALQHARWLALAEHDTGTLSLPPFDPPVSPQQTPLPSHVENTPPATGLVAFLRNISRTLESLHNIFHIDALLLVVSPHDPPGAANKPNNDGWLGGTRLGRDFWRGLRGGGVTGARAFKQKSVEQWKIEQQIEPAIAPSSSSAGPSAQSTFVENPMPTTSTGVKAELNRMMRDSLRAVSGNAVAEMKWTKPSSLPELYGVDLVGWPEDVPCKNPSDNPMEINRRLLQALRDGRMGFTPHLTIPALERRELKRPRV